MQGFLFTVAAAPELVPPSEWLPMIFGGHEPEYESLDEAKAVLGALMDLYNTFNAAVTERCAALPSDCPFRDEAVANLEDDAPVAQWSRGFLRGHQWLEESWDACLPEEVADEFAATLLVLSFFSSKRMATAFLAEAGHQDLGAMAESIRKVFEDAVVEYAHIGRSIHEVLVKADQAPAGPASRAKAGRNDPCPCGSGRKYKKCCGAPA